MLDGLCYPCNTDTTVNNDKVKKMTNTTKYCPTCNYPREPDERNVHTNEKCPMCDLERLDVFYNVGSETHRRVLDGEKLQPTWALRAPEL